MTSQHPLTTRVLTAVTRHVSPGVAKCELTTIDREPISLGRVEEQHAAYVALIRKYLDKAPSAGRVMELPAIPDHADSMFMEDVAIMNDECAVLTRPGVESRRGEIAHVAATLESLRPGNVLRIVEPGTIEGGDTLTVGRNVFVGKSTRTNVDGFNQLKAFLEPRGFHCEQIDVAPGHSMHLKCGVTLLTDDTVLLNRHHKLPTEPFTKRGLKVVEVNEAGDAGNVLSFVVGGQRVIVVAAAFPTTAEILRDWAAKQPAPQPIIETLQVDEIAKAEGALTCCSLISYTVPRCKDDTTCQKTEERDADQA